MEEAIPKLNKFKNKSFTTLKVHGLCKCGVYYCGTLAISPLALSFPNEAIEPVTTHFVLVCWKCKRLVNLVSVTKEPLKKE